MCSHTTLYVLIQLRVCPYTSICVLIQLHVHRCPHTTTYFSSCYYMTLCVSSLYLAPRSPSMCPHSTRRCILILLRVSSASLLLHVRTHTTIFVSSYYYMSPSASLPLQYRCASYYYICFLILLYVSLSASLPLPVSSYYHMCPHTLTCYLCVMPE
jgi:hypothetical protein